MTDQIRITAADEIDRGDDLRCSQEVRETLSSGSFRWVPCPADALYRVEVDTERDQRAEWVCSYHLPKWVQRARVFLPLA